MQRSDRVGDEIRTAIADILQTGIKDPRLSAMVSVVEVRASRDLSHAHIYVSVFGDEQQKKDALAALRSASGFIRRELMRRVRLRVAPELHFVIDDSIARGIRLSQLIDEANANRPAGTPAGGAPLTGPAAGAEASAQPDEGTDAEDLRADDRPTGEDSLPDDDSLAEEAALPGDDRMPEEGIRPEDRDA